VKKLPLYAERALGELQATRGYTATEFEREFRAQFPVTCKPSCVNCCYHPILITIAEGILLFRFLASKGRLTSSLRKKLQDHGQLTSFLDGKVWMQSMIPCPLLNDKLQCSGYEARPLACRLTFSAGDPEKCHPQTFDPEEMASTQDLTRVTRAFEDKLLKSHAVSAIRMSVGRAIQLAEQVISGEIAIDAIERALYQDFTSP